LSNNEPFIPKPALIDDDDVYKWEIDFKSLIDQIYHELQGESEVDGVWSPDPDKIRRVNESGASIIKQNLSSRINKGMSLTRLDNKIIMRICAGFGKNTAELLFDNIDKWEIEPKKFSNMWDLCNMLVDNLEIMLRMSEAGGMRAYRQGSRAPPVMSHGLHGNIGAY